MTKLNEANVNLSIQDLNSSDMAALSQILSLAGQAEQPECGADMSGPLSMAGPDGALGSDVGSVDLGTPTVSVGSMDDAAGAYDMGSEPGVDDPMGMEMPDNEPPEMALDDMGSELDGMDTMDDEGTADLGLDDEDGMDAMDMEMMEDLDRLAALSGIQLAEAEEEVEMDDDEMIVEEDMDEDADEIEEGCGSKSKVKEEEDMEEEVQLDEAEDSDFDWMDSPEKEGKPDADNNDADDNEPEQADGGEPAWMRESLDSIMAVLEGEDACTGCDNPDCSCHDDDEQLDENAEGHYNFDLDEDAVGEMTSPGIGDNRIFGPYPNEQACMIDARKEIPGAMRDKEIKLAHKPDGWYWSKLNGGAVMEADQTVDDLAKQLNEQFNAFMKGE